MTRGEIKRRVKKLEESQEAHENAVQAPWVQLLRESGATEAVGTVTTEYCTNFRDRIPRPWSEQQRAASQRLLHLLSEGERAPLFEYHGPGSQD